MQVVGAGVLDPLTVLVHDHERCAADHQTVVGVLGLYEFLSSGECSHAVIVSWRLNYCENAMLTLMTSFLGSAGLRWLLGELIGVFKLREERRAEIEMLRLQAELEAQRSERQRQAVLDAAAAGVKLIEAQREAHTSEASDAMMLEALRQVGQPTGVKWVDAWNGGIRPMLATLSILLIVASAVWPAGVSLTGIVAEVVAGVLGLYVGGRIHATGR